MTEALRLVAEIQIDLAVVDIPLKSRKGIDLIKRIKHHNEHVRILSRGERSSVKALAAILSPCPVSAPRAG
jgi:two-component SAPR family response regulator